MGKAKTIRRWVKLTLYTQEDADVIALIEQLTQCGRLSSTVIAALRVYENVPTFRQKAQTSVVSAIAQAQDLSTAQAITYVEKVVTLPKGNGHIFRPTVRSRSQEDVLSTVDEAIFTFR